MEKSNKKKVQLRKNAITIIVCLIMVVVIGLVIYFKTAKDPLLGDWISTDGIHTYRFEPNLITIGSTVNSYKEYYGYINNGNCTITINKNGGNQTVKYTFTKDVLILMADGVNSDSSERLIRADSQFDTSK